MKNLNEAFLMLFIPAMIVMATNSNAVAENSTGYTLKIYRYIGKKYYQSEEDCKAAKKNLSNTGICVAGQQ